jgi:hypothetical protein
MISSARRMIRGSSVRLPESFSQRLAPAVADSLQHQLRFGGSVAFVDWANDTKGVDMAKGVK